MKVPRLSVVIPLYKGGKYAEDAISSVLAQTFTDYEIIIVDNNASEESQRYAYPFAEKFPEKIRVVRENVQGVCSARNKGILDAKGELIALLDDDDLMYPDRLERQVELYDKHPESSIISCWYDIILPDGTIHSSRDSYSELFFAKILQDKPERNKENPCIHNLPSTMLFSKMTALKAGIFDTRFNPCGMEDMDFSFRMYQQGSILLSTKPGVIYRYTEGEFEMKKWNELGVRTLTLWKKTDLLFSILQSQIPKNLESNKKIKKIQSQWLREFGCFLMQFPEMRMSAKHLLKRALRSGPFDYKAWKSYLRSFYPASLYGKAFHFEVEREFPKSFAFPEGFENTYFSISPSFFHEK